MSEPLTPRVRITERVEVVAPGEVSVVVRRLTDDEWATLDAERARQAGPVGLSPDDLETLARAHAIGAVSHDGDAWFAFDAGYGYDEADVTMAAAGAILARLASLPAQAVEPVGLRYRCNGVMVPDPQGKWLPAQAVEPGPLDVERLADAISEVRAKHGANWSSYDWLAAEASGSLTPAEVLAAEYARLSPDKQPKGAG